MCSHNIQSLRVAALAAASYTPSIEVQFCQPSSRLNLSHKGRCRAMQGPRLPVKDTVRHTPMAKVSSQEKQRGGLSQTPSACSLCLCYSACTVSETLILWLHSCAQDIVYLRQMYDIVKFMTFIRTNPQLKQLGSFKCHSRPTAAKAMQLQQDVSTTRHCLPIYGQKL